MIIRPKKKTIRIWQTRALFCFVALGLALCFALQRPKYIYLPMAVLLFASLLAVFVFIPAHIGSCEIICKKSAIIIKKGVLFKALYVFPREKVLIKTFSPLFSQKLGLCAIAVKDSVRWTLFPEVDICEAKHLERM